MKVLLGISWTMGGTLGFAAWQWVLMLVAARSAGGIESLGALSVALAISTPSFLLFGMSLRQVAATDIRSRFADDHYLLVRFCGVLSAVVVNVVLGAFVAEGELALLVVCCSLLKATEALADITYGIRQRAGREVTAGISQAAKAVCQSALFAVCIEAGMTLSASLLAVAALALLMSIVADGLRPHVTIRRILNLATCRGLAAGSLALTHTAFQSGVAACLVAVSSGWPRMVLQEELDLGAVGLFTAVMWVFLPGHVLSNALCQSLVGRAAATQSLKGGGSLYRYIMLFCLAAGAPTLLPGVLLVVTGIEPTSLLFGVGLLVGPEMFLLASLANFAIAIASGFNYGAAAVHAHNIQFASAAASTCVCLLGSIVLIGLWGIDGALLAVLAAASVQSVISATMLSRRLFRQELRAV